MRSVLLPLIALLPSSAVATNCAELRPFAAATRSAPLIVEAEVIRYGGARHATAMPEYMDVQVHTVYKGSLAAKRLRVHGDNGLSGRRSVIAYPVNTRWIFVLTTYCAPTSVRPQNAFAFPDCVAPALAVIGSQVFGTIGQPTNERFSRARLPELIRFWRQRRKD